MRRDRLLRMVRSRLTLDGVPLVAYPARWKLICSERVTLFFIKSGSSRSSRKMSRNSSRDRTKPKLSSPSPSGLPSRPAEPLPPLGRGMRSPSLYSLLPGRTPCCRPVFPSWRNRGSRRLSEGIAICSPSARSRMLRSAEAWRTASATWRLTRRTKRWRLARLLPWGFCRRSITRTCSPLGLAGLLDPHVPFHQPSDLSLGIATLDHALDEFTVLALGFGLLLALETDHRQQVFHLAEHPPLDHLADLFIGRPGGVLAPMLGTGTQGELHHLISEILGVRDARRLLDLAELLVQQLAIHHLAGIGILEIVVLDPGVGKVQIAVEEVLSVVVV